MENAVRCDGPRSRIAPRSSRAATLAQTHRGHSHFAATRRGRALRVGMTVRLAVVARRQRRARVPHRGHLRTDAGSAAARAGAARSAACTCPDLLELTRPADVPGRHRIRSKASTSADDPADARAFSRDVQAAMPGVLARPPRESAARQARSACSSAFICHRHRHDHRRHGLPAGADHHAGRRAARDRRRPAADRPAGPAHPRRRSCSKALLVAGVGAVFGLVLALVSEGLINRFFQWRYDTALVFVRITPDVALTCVCDRRAARRRRHGAGLVGAAPPQRPAAGAPMNALGFAWRSLVRQPARAALGVLGVAAVGALLFDMLLLSHGLIVSMRDLLDRARIRRSGHRRRRPAAAGHGSAAPRDDRDAIAALPAVRGRARDPIRRRAQSTAATASR